MKTGSNVEAREPKGIRIAESLIEGINLRLAMTGCPTFGEGRENGLPGLAGPMFSRQMEAMRLLADYFCPADSRIHRFLRDYLRGTGIEPKLPSRTFVLDSPGLARLLSLPPDGDEFVSDIMRSYRVSQGVLHNPANDRRTTQGVFHIAEGGLPVPDDKMAVPAAVFGRLLQEALRPPPALMRLPFTSTQQAQAECYVSLLLRPVVCPAVPGFIEEKSMEVRFFAPGNLVSNLDFVETIFGNAGDPFLPENDAGLDVDHWTGHTGCVILAPHLVRLTKKSLGLPRWEDATERQRRDGMCWREEGELYNNGGAFKITARGLAGVIVTIIADNYYGYCKKEVKAHISYAANLHGLCEEEHAGGALVSASYDLGEEFYSDKHVQDRGHSFDEVTRLFGEAMDLRQPEGYGVDLAFPEIIYVPQDARFDLHRQRVSWRSGGAEQAIRMRAGEIYVRPSGYQVRMEKPGNRGWRLVGTRADAILCHKPCTVSGGGKSEISKSISDAIIQGPVFVADFKKDFDRVEALVKGDYSDRFKDPARNGRDRRGVLSPDRSLGSVIKLFTPSESEYSEEHNRLIEAAPQHIRELLFVVKRFYRAEWGICNWREHFSVDIINGKPANELKCENRKLASNYLRVGYDPAGASRVFGLRKDFHPAAKLQMEDDITASVVAPIRALERLEPESSVVSVKFVKNCELSLFQRPDDAIRRGYDSKTERDLAESGNFMSNFEPLTVAAARELVEDAVAFAQYTQPMQEIILNTARNAAPRYCVSSAHPRVINGKPSKNPRYLQMRPDLANPRDAYLAEMSMRLQRRIPLSVPVLTPVNAVMPGRRNHPPDPEGRIRSLAVFNPIHFMELPELFMEFISSITGKSPSTTGAGSEGALTKGPFNALPPIIDLNAALVSHILTGETEYNGAFLSAAGCVGPRYRVDHDISLLMPELWCRMKPAERRPAFQIRGGYFEKCEDIAVSGRVAPGSRLGYRMNRNFVRTFLARIFSHPLEVFPDALLRPETQDPEVYADGLANIVETHKAVAANYFNDGSIEMACPPLRALLHLMAGREYEGWHLGHPEFRALFTREQLLGSDWYARRLAAQQRRDIEFWEGRARYLQAFLEKEHYQAEAARLGIRDRLEKAWATYHDVKAPKYLEILRGTIGRQPM